jgi:hypothetical protein
MQPLALPRHVDDSREARISEAPAATLRSGMPGGGRPGAGGRRAAERAYLAVVAAEARRLVRELQQPRQVTTVARPENSQR